MHGGHAIASRPMARIDVAAEADLPELLTLMRGYCDFYEVAPADEDLLIMSRALIADPVREGMQLIARDESGRAIGFATIFWTWSTTKAARIGVMNDIFVAQGARGSGVADELIAACLGRCRRRGAARLTWRTALDNHRAQAVYDRVGARRSQWLDYDLPVQQEEKAQ
jgi:GNAT superfamily N-acetyltransferase